MNPKNDFSTWLFMGISLFSFLFGCAADQTLIPRDQAAQVDRSNPAVSDGFDFPLPGYYPTGSRFLQENLRSMGCPSSFHPGEDVAGRPNSPIYAASNGTVVFADYQHELSGYLVVLEHTPPPGIRFKLPDGTRAEKIWSAYYHMSGIDEKNIALHRVIRRGTRIGFMGDFPHGSGKRYHLHFEIRKVNLWQGSAYISAGKREYGICRKPAEWIAERFVAPSEFIKLNRPQ